MPKANNTLSLLINKT